MSVARQETRQARQEAQKAQEKLSKLKQGNRRQNKTARSAKNKTNQSKKDLDNQRIQLSRLNENYNKLSEDHKELKQDNTKITTTLDKSREQLTSLQQEKETVINALNKQKEDLEDTQEELKKEQIERKNLRQENQNILRIYDVIKQLNKEQFLSKTERTRRQIEELLDSIPNHQLKQALLLAIISEVHEQLSRHYKEREQFSEASKKLSEANNTIQESKDWLEKSNPDPIEHGLIHVYVKRVEGNLLREKGEVQKAREAYMEAFNILESWKKPPPYYIKNKINITSFIHQSQPILSVVAVGNLHRQLIELLREETGRQSNELNNCQELLVSQEDTQPLICKVWISFGAHLLAELEKLMDAGNWKDADRYNDQVMLYIVGREEKGFLNFSDIENFSCAAFRTINELWVQRSEGKFSFSVKKEIF